MALGAGALVDRTARTWPAWSRAAALAVVAACVIWGGLAVADSRGSGKPASLRAEAEQYLRIGELVGHSSRVLALDGAYGSGVQYHGFVFTSHWPLSGDLALMSLTGESAGAVEARLHASGAEYFVGTVQAEFDAQADLKQRLEREYALLERDGTPEQWAFVAYDLRRQILSATPKELSLFTRIADPTTPEQTVSLFTPAARAGP